MMHTAVPKRPTGAVKEEQLPQLSHVDQHPAGVIAATRGERATAPRNLKREPGHWLEGPDDRRIAHLAHLADGWHESFDADRGAKLRKELSCQLGTPGLLLAEQGRERAVRQHDRPADRILDASPLDAKGCLRRPCRAKSDRAGDVEPASDIAVLVRIDASETRWAMSAGLGHSRRPHSVYQLGDQRAFACLRRGLRDH